ncbi:MAG: hypothetical protein JO202_03180 [Ktedonobacteraceae bacterium]|nr:hypothetical protein [Ktedonobacteraceae bacterium]
MVIDLPVPIVVTAKTSRPIATLVANTLQIVYEHNRVPETWGTPSVSRQTFDTLRILWRSTLSAQR